MKDAEKSLKAQVIQLIKDDNKAEMNIKVMNYKVAVRWKKLGMYLTGVERILRIRTVALSGFLKSGKKINFFF